MIKEIKEWLLTCPECQQRRNPKNKPPLLPRPGVTANKPFQVVAVDIIGPLPQSTEGFKWILVFIDVFTKFAEAFPLRGIGGRTVAKIFIEQIVCRYGAPRALLSDLGRQFIGKIAQATYRLLTVKKLNTSGYHPQTNGLCERFNSTLKIMLRMYIDLDRQNWSKFIPYCVFAYNTSVQETTKHTPYYMVFGRGATLPIDVMTRTDDEVYTNEDEFIKKRIINMRLAHQFAEAAHRKIHLKYLANLEASKHEKYEVGDKVYCKIYTPKLGVPMKQALLWHGPYIILEVKPNGVNYIIRRFKKKAKELFLVHVKNLRPFHVIETSLRKYPNMEQKVEEE